MATITQIQYIVTVDKLKHFGQAALACHVSQPSLSAQIQKVEDEIGFRIFDRNKKPITLTTRGHSFLEQAKVVLREHFKLQEISKHSQQELIGQLNLGIIPTVSPYLTPKFIAHFAKNFPKVNLKIEEIKTEHIIKHLKNNELDCGILATPLHEKQLIETPLYVEDFYLYVGAKHPLAEKTKINENDLDGKDLWLLEDGHCFRNQIVKLCSLSKDAPVFKNISFQSGNLDTLRNLVKTNGGSTILPASLVHSLPRDERQRSVRPFKAPIPARQISLVTHQTQWKLDLIKALYDSITTHVGRDFEYGPSHKSHQILEID